MGIGQILKRSISKTYVILVILITSITIGSYISYAMFTVTEEKNNAISIVTGSLYYQLTVEGTNTTSMSVPASTTKTYTVVLTNNNNRTARFNFYYVGDLASNVEIGYLTSGDIPPAAEGINLDANASQTYQIQVMNNSSNTTTINLGVSVGLDYNDLSLPNDGHLFEEIQYKTVAEALLAGVGEKGSINTSDREQTFITGEDPNNYIWYSGKLWRAVSIDPTDNSVKLVTQWNISAIPYNTSGNTAFEGSDMEDWLNDTSVDGFLGNLREPEKFIKMDSKWNATMTEDTSKPPKTAIVEAAVGLLNIYEYTISYSGTTYQNGYLNNGLEWWTLTPYSMYYVRSIYGTGTTGNDSPWYAYGARPSINLKSNVKIVSGEGTESNPYRLEGDNDSNLNGILLNTRYSGEYIRFGIDENNLYRIVSHETSGLTKITSAEPLKSNGSFITSAFGDNVNYSSSNTIGSFLNGEYLTNYVGSSYRNMIEPSTTWYLGIVGPGKSYRLAKYSSITGNDLTTSTTIADVGLLRLGELMLGQLDRHDNNTMCWTLTPYSASRLRYVNYRGNADVISPSNTYGVRPVMNLKSSVVITGGSGTKSDPFTLSLD